MHSKSLSEYSDEELLAMYKREKYLVEFNSVLQAALKVLN